MRIFLPLSLSRMRKAFTGNNYIAQMINSVFLAYCCVPSFHHCFVHLLARRKWTQWRAIGLYEGQAFGMSEVGVCSDESAHDYLAPFPRSRSRHRTCKSESRSSSSAHLSNWLDRSIRRCPSCGVRSTSLASAIVSLKKSKRNFGFMVLRFDGAPV
jgi:hypothetical protein